MHRWPPPSATANGYIWTLPGREVTEPCYDSVYAPDYYTEEPLVYRRAAPLLNGYAPVSRDGKFGLLDSTGAEFVPCAYDGLVWDGGTAWVRLGDGWHEYSIPGVTKPDPLDDLPESIVSTRHAAPHGRILYFSSVDTAGASRLNLRAVPGPAYGILGKLPPPCACTGIPPPPKLGTGPV